MPAPPHHGAKSRKFIARHHLIVDRAAREFARRGYASTSVTDLCEANGLGRGNLYYYVGSKEALLVEIHDRVMDPLLEQGERIRHLPIAPAMRLRLISEALLTAIVERLDHVWVFLHEHRQLTGTARERFTSRRREFAGLVEELIQQCIDEGSFNLDDANLATLAYFNLHNYTYQWIRPDGPMTPADLSRFYCRVLFTGFAAPDEFDIDATEEGIARLGGFSGLIGSPRG